MGEWSELLGDILDAIGKRLIYSDYIRFCGVCVQWKSLLPKRPRLQIPWLMLPFNEESETHCSLYSVLEKKVYPLELPQARGKLYRGSSNGWLAMVEDGPELKLLNPLTCVQIDLPPITTLPNVKEYVVNRRGEEYAVFRPENDTTYYFDRNHIQNNFVWKVVLSSSHMSSNCNNNYTAVTIYGEFCRLAFCKHGDKEWTASSLALQGYCDAIFYEEKFYVITSGGSLAGCRIDSLPKINTIPVQRIKFSANNNLYLIGTSRGLMVVERCWKIWGLVIPAAKRHVCNYATSKFKIYRLDTSKPRKRWSNVKSLGDHIMFLGCNSSVLIPSQNFPELKSNCIYFADDNLECHVQGFVGGFDVGVFDMEDGSIKQLPGYTGDKRLVWPPPVWVVPSCC